MAGTFWSCTQNNTIRVRRLSTTNWNSILSYSKFDITDSVDSRVLCHSSWYKSAIAYYYLSTNNKQSNFLFCRVQTRNLAHLKHCAKVDPGSTINIWFQLDAVSCLDVKAKLSKNPELKSVFKRLKTKFFTDWQNKYRSCIRLD